VRARRPPGRAVDALRPADEEFRDPYRRLDFLGGREIVMRFDADVPADRVWDLPRQAILEALASLQKVRQPRLTS